MKKRTIFGLLALMLMGIVAAAGTVSAFGFGFMQDRESIDEAIQNNDFGSWKTTMESQLTQENFNSLVERHNSMSFCRDIHESLQQAIEEEDYDAYVEAASSSTGCPMPTLELSEEDFEILVGIHQAREEGDFETAHELMAELDLEMPLGVGPAGGRMHGGMRGKGRGSGNCMGSIAPQSE